MKRQRGVGPVLMTSVWVREGKKDEGTSCEGGKRQADQRVEQAAGKGEWRQSKGKDGIRMSEVYAPIRNYSQLCFVPCGTITRSPAFTSLSSPATIAFASPLVKIKC